MLVKLLGVVMLLAVSAMGQNTFVSRDAYKSLDSSSSLPKCASDVAVPVKAVYPPKSERPSEVKLWNGSAAAWLKKKEFSALVSQALNYVRNATFSYSKKRKKKTDVVFWIPCAPGSK